MMLFLNPLAKTAELGRRYPPGGLHVACIDCRLEDEQKGTLEKHLVNWSTLRTGISCICALVIMYSTLRLGDFIAYGFRSEMEDFQR